METKEAIRNFFLSKTGKIVMIAVMYFVMFFVVLNVGNFMIKSDSAFGTIMTFAFYIFCGYFGWQALARITPNIFLFLPVVGWIIYFVIKGILSVMIGVFVTPYVISKKITGVIQRKLR